MSLILDALNRSRQDLGDVPGLDSQHHIDESRPATSHLWWVLALVIALTVIVYLLYERGEETAPAGRLPEPAIVPEQSLERPQTAQAEPDMLAAPVPPAPAAALAQPKPDAEVAALYEKKSPPAKALSAPGPAPRAKQVEQPASPAPVAQETVSEQPVDIEAMMNQARGELENAQLEEHPAPFLAGLSQQSKDRIPTIFYERHDYSGTTGQSAVVLNGKALKPGDRTSSGVIVDEILPDSVVLTYQGTQFRLRALNSWVNL
jgi:hypothetical protein